MRLRKSASWVLGLFVLTNLLVSLAQAQGASDQAARMRGVLASPDRADADKALDAARKPLEVIQFLGVTDGMTALDVIAAGGWYTTVLSAAVGPTGKVYSQNPPFFANREGFVEAEQVRNERLGNVQPIHGEVAEGNINGQIDVAITNQNLHDFYNRGGEAGAMPIIKGVYDALKPGGVFGVMDHRGVAGQPNADLHRMESAAARDLLTKAGFVIEGESEILANPADDHTRGPGDASLGGKSDRFLIKARKPN
jgi:predicted methyltransferase